MYLEIITPEKKLFEGEIHLIKLPGSIGAFEILKNHAPIISTLSTGQIKVIQEDGDVNYFEIKGGVVECSDNKVIVLAEAI